MMLAADRIAANGLTASPELCDALYRKYLGISEEWLRSHGASEAEEAQETLDSVEQIARRVKMDLWYINNWSLWLDIQILIKTLFEVLRKRNAF